MTSPSAIWWMISIWQQRNRSRGRNNIFLIKCTNLRPILVDGTRSENPNKNAARFSRGKGAKRGGPGRGHGWGGTDEGGREAEKKQWISRYLCDAPHEREPTHNTHAHTHNQRKHAQTHWFLEPERQRGNVIFFYILNYIYNFTSFYFYTFHHFPHRFS